MQRAVGSRLALTPRLSRLAVNGVNGMNGVTPARIHTANSARVGHH